MTAEIRERERERDSDKRQFIELQPFAVEIKIAMCVES